MAPPFRTRPGTSPFQSDLGVDAIAAGYGRVTSSVGRGPIKAALKTYGIKPGSLRGKSDQQLLDMAANKIVGPLLPTPKPQPKPKPKPPRRPRRTGQTNQRRPRRR